MTMAASPPTRKRAVTPDVRPSVSYKPTTADILIVKQYLKSIFITFADELIDVIVDDASYWAHTSVTVNRTVVTHEDGDIMYMRTLPLAVYGTEGDLLLDEENLQGDSEGFDLGGLPPAEARWAAPTRAEPFRKIEFQLWSHDQGWGGDYDSQGTYNGSYSWFDASVERLDSVSWLTGSIKWPFSLISAAVDLSDDLTDDLPADAPNLPDDFTFVRKDVKRPFLPSPSTLQKNFVAEDQTTHHIVTWSYCDNVKEDSPEAIAAESKGRGRKSYDGSFVRDLQVGDCITMRARFPGWSNNAVKAKITVYWAV
ncbi:hypothetical protein EV702DRAFT_1192283 [Suillus placidus]|uniref:Uncharacterized protein n=1 Tax=Suillus placidus TaxID=48579 RepID=A0A9P7D8N2_9AGAM|nr:hypothetical protein EV702DRAFT_1192283 [Suillus placidus]